MTCVASKLEHHVHAQTGLVSEYDVIVIGGGQAGLSVGYHLAQRGLRFVILDAHERVGDSWRKRWTSLRLFTPARFDGLVGLPFPLPPHTFPTHDQMADYLEQYAAHFELPVQSRVRVDSLTECGGRYLVKAGARTFEAAQVVVAMASYQEPRVPGFAQELSPDLVQLHSSAYRGPEQLREGPVLIVGAGNSGAEISLEVAKAGHRVWLSGRDTGQVPFRIAGFWGKWLLGPVLLRLIFHRLLTIATPVGRRLRAKLIAAGGPLIRTRQADLSRAGVQRCASVAHVQDGLPVLADGSTRDVTNVIWCTGYHPGFSWIDLPIFDSRHEPEHVGGEVPRAPGLYFVGLHFLYSMSSTMIHGVGRDAARIVNALIRRRATLLTQGG
ncbi:MAG TPA: FAD-dependent oxidoreductase [Polyangiaceae bacterium]|nr:FAD-dependent oxidoreductase [Polyangiaceae bacterium]